MKIALVSAWRILLYDCLLGMACMYGAVHLRYQLAGKSIVANIDLKASFVFFGTCFVCWLLFSVHKGVWRFSALNDVWRLLRVVVLSSCLTPLVLFLFFERADNFPRSVPFIVGVLFFVVLVLSRALVMFWRNGDVWAIVRPHAGTRQQIVLIGSDQLLHDYMRNQSQNARLTPYAIRALIEINQRYGGRYIRGVQVIDGQDDSDKIACLIESVCTSKPHLVLLDKQVSRQTAAALVDLAARLGTRLHRLDLNISDGLLPFEVADLIGRPLRDLDMSAVKAMIADKTVLVTGAGGTIGSELCRQLFDLSPARLCMIDNGEGNLYALEQKIRNLEKDKPPQKSFLWSTHLADVCDTLRMQEIFVAYTPDIVLHAAALKHVPLMEANPLEALRVNVGGTFTVMQLARAQKASQFILISTDKAVSPNNVMGASKAIAELVVHSGATKEMRGAAVRFGNVLGSSGSVIPLFEQQIAQGGPLTVTDKQATRFFMSVQEASSLVLQTLSLKTKTPANYMLDMGAAVNIYQLACALARLRGREPGHDIDIDIIGLRAGEKLHETLIFNGEVSEPTLVEGVLRLVLRGEAQKISDDKVKLLLEACQARNYENANKLIHDILPECKIDIGKGI